jgi:hypothetical protein
VCGFQVRIILNKSDQVDQQQLMRVYGALMWSLGKVFKSPEVCKVSRTCYITITCSGIFTTSNQDVTGHKLGYVSHICGT